MHGMKQDKGLALHQQHVPAGAYYLPYLHAYQKRCNRHAIGCRSGRLFDVILRRRGRRLSQRVSTLDAGAAETARSKEPSVILGRHTIIYGLLERAVVKVGGGS